MSKLTEEELKDLLNNPETQRLLDSFLLQEKELVDPRVKKDKHKSFINCSTNICFNCGDLKEKFTLMEYCERLSSFIGKRNATEEEKKELKINYNIYVDIYGCNKCPEKLLLKGKEELIERIMLLPVDVEIRSRKMKERYLKEKEI